MSNALNTFFGAWSHADDATRLGDIAQSVAADGRYVDPRTPEPMIGPDAIAGYVAMFAQAAPGAQAVVTDSQDRDGITRATIAFRMADGMEQLGQYFVEHNEEGKISRMVGFVGTGAPK